MGEYTPTPAGRRTIPLRKKDIRLWLNGTLLDNDSPQEVLAQADAVTICLENQKNGHKNAVLHHTTVGYLKLVSIKRVSSARAWTLARPNSSMEKKRDRRDCYHSFVVWLYTPSISDFYLYQSLSTNTYIHQYSTRSGEDTAVWISRERERERKKGVLLKVISIDLCRRSKSFGFQHKHQKRCAVKRIGSKKPETIP